MLATSITNPDSDCESEPTFSQKKILLLLLRTPSHREKRCVGSARSVRVIGGEAPSGGHLRASPTWGCCCCWAAEHVSPSPLLNGWHSSVTSVLQHCYNNNNSFSNQMGNNNRSNAVPLSEPSCSKSISVVLPVGKASSNHTPSQECIGGVEEQAENDQTSEHRHHSGSGHKTHKQRIVADVRGIEERSGANLGDGGKFDEDELSLDIKWELEEEHQEAVESGDEENVIQHVGINVQVMKWQ